MDTKTQFTILPDRFVKFIEDGRVKNEGNQYSGSIDLGDRTSGVYILVVQQGERTHQIKLLRK
jgi:hypothetical protein